MAISSPQLHSKDFLANKGTILTEDDVLHYRRSSLGEQPLVPSDTSSNDEDNDGDLLGIDMFVVVNQVNCSPITKTTSETSCSSQQPLVHTDIRGTISSYNDPQSWIYFPTGWSVTELCKEARNTTGVTAYVNGLYVNLYLVRQIVYCSDQKCPHAGGPLNLGEIEEVPAGMGAMDPCIVCPWHKYCFNLSTGNIQRPYHRPEHLHVYPTRIEPNGIISIGFKSFHESFFLDENF